VKVAVGLFKAKVTGYSGVMGVMKKRETNVRVSRDANK
jgi:hypothetical protein